MNYLLKLSDELKEPNPLFESFLDFINLTDKLNTLSVLEIGIGIGNKSIPLSKKFKKYYGLEQNELIYNKFLKMCNIHNCTIKSYNMDYYKFIEKTNKIFNLIILINIIYFFDLDIFFEKSIKILNNSYILIQNPKAKPYGWGNAEMNIDSELFNNEKWTKFKTKLVNTDNYLVSSKYLIKKESNVYYNIYLLQII